jgi:hypothetical protein
MRVHSHWEVGAYERSKDFCDSTPASGWLDRPLGGHGHTAALVGTQQGPDGWPIGWLGGRLHWPGWRLCLDHRLGVTAQIHAFSAS